MVWGVWRTDDELNARFRNAFMSCTDVHTLRKVDVDNHDGCTEQSTEQNALHEEGFMGGYKMKAIR